MKQLALYPVTGEDAMPNSLSTALTFYPAYCFALSPTHNTWARLFASDVHALRERKGYEGILRILRRVQNSISDWLFRYPTTFLHSLTPLYPGQNLYFHLNHPIKWIRLVGVIVAFDVYPTRWIMILDDSSGTTIEMTCRRPGPAKDFEPQLPGENVSSIINTSDARGESMKGITAMGGEVDLNGVDVGTVVKAKGGVGSWRGEKQMLLERICILCLSNPFLVTHNANTPSHPQQSFPPPTKKSPPGPKSPLSVTISSANRGSSMTKTKNKRGERQKGQTASRGQGRSVKGEKRRKTKSGIVLLRRSRGLIGAERRRNWRGRPGSWRGSPDSMRLRMRERREAGGRE